MCIYVCKSVMFGIEVLCLYMICALQAALMHIHSVKQVHEVKWEFKSQEASQQSVHTYRYRDCQVKEGLEQRARCILMSH